MSQKTCIKELLYGEEPVGEGNRKIVRIRALAKASVFFYWSIKGASHMERRKCCYIKGRQIGGMDEN